MASPGRRPALLYTFISFIALGGLLAFYGISLFNFDSFAQTLQTPDREQELRPATTAINAPSGRPISVVQEEFNPHATYSIPEAVADNAVPSQPTVTVSTVPPPANTQIPAPAAVIHASTADVDFTDPFNITRNVYYGPWRGEVPQTVISGEPFQMNFFCLSPDQSLCPPYYRVFFHGPSRQTVLPNNFTKTRPMRHSPYEYANVTATWIIRDPGEYMVYAYPEFSFCGIWNQMQFPWYKAAVMGVPFKMQVRATSSQQSEGYGTCAPDDIVNGRFLSTNTSISPKQFTDLYPDPSLSFAWAPYNCKIPHRTVPNAVKDIPSVKHFLWLGDSTTRGPFCAKVWEQIHGDVIDSVCDYKSGTVPYWDMKWGHKFTHKVFEVDGEERNVSFSFLWTPDDMKNVLGPLLSLKDPPPTHVIFNIGLWVSWVDDDSLQKMYWEFLELMQKHFAGVVQHVILKTTVSAVHQVQCSDNGVTYNYEPEGEFQGTRDSILFRYGGSNLRFAVYRVAQTWNKMYANNPPFRVSVVDAWLLTDNRPETTSEGRHWIAEDKKFKSLRQGIGEADDSILDWIWDEFVNERMTF